MRSPKQEKYLTWRRNQSLEAAAENDLGFSCQGIIGKFIGLYLRCEVFATKLQHFFQKDKQFAEGHLNVRTLSKALRHFNLHFKEESLLLLLKGGHGEKGKKSARQLRNGFLHELSESNKIEIINKGPELIKLMESFLSLRL